MKKIAILGARGYVGSNLASILSDSCELTLFSHQSDREFNGQLKGSNGDFSVASILGHVNDFHIILFLLESRGGRDREYIYKLFQEIVNESKTVKVIFFSTFSIYSKWLSTYATFKKKIEHFSENYENVYIVRPGVIYGGTPGGLYKTFITLGKRSYLLLPASDAVTGYVHVSEIAKYVLKVDDFEIHPKIYPLVDVYMSLEEAFNYFGFRGVMIGLPSNFIRILVSSLNRVFGNKITSLQSLSSIISMNIPSELVLTGSGGLIMRKIILAQFSRINRIKGIKLSIRGFIRAIERSNSLEAYLELTKSAKYIYLKRLFEIYSLNLKNEI